MQIVSLRNRNGQTQLDIFYEKNPFDKDSIRLVQDKMGQDEELMTWFPQETIDKTMDWIRRQPRNVQESGFYCPFIQKILNDSFIDFRYLCILLVDLVAQIMLVLAMSFGVHAENC